MRPVLLVALVVIAFITAMTIARAMSGGTNIEEREKYWAKEISEGLKAGATTEELKRFANYRGQVVRCRQGNSKEGECGFEDNQSRGGTRSIPMRLSVTFTMKDDAIASHKFETIPIETTPANKSN